MRDLTQAELAEWMGRLGFYPWSRITVANLEKGTRITSIDELFGLAIILKIRLVKLLDPTASGDRDQGVDMGHVYPEGFKPREARAVILNDDNPWDLELEPDLSYAEYLHGLRQRADKRLTREMDGWGVEQD